MAPALRKPNYGRQPRGHLAFPAIPIHLVEESAVADTTGIASSNERRGIDARRIGQAQLVEDRTVPQHLLEAPVRLPIRERHPRSVPPDQIGRIVAGQLLGISLDDS